MIVLQKTNWFILVTGKIHFIFLGKKRKYLGVWINVLGGVVNVTYLPVQNHLMVIKLLWYKTENPTWVV